MRFKILAGCGLFVLVCLFQGCGRAPQMSTHNRKVLESLQTAVSAKNPEWLGSVEEQVVKIRAKQEMSDTEYHAIHAILTKAKTGKWKDALKDSFSLSQGQRPSAQDLAMLKDRKSPKQAIPN